MQLFSFSALTVAYEQSFDIQLSWLSIKNFTTLFSLSVEQETKIGPKLGELVLLVGFSNKTWWIF